MGEGKKSDNVASCIRCGYVTDEKDKFCVSCGAPLINRCTKKASPLHKACGKVNPPHAAYCAACGSPTTFKEYGLLS